MGCHCAPHKPLHCVVRLNLCPHHTIMPESTPRLRLKLVVNRYIPSQCYWVLRSEKPVSAREAETAVVNWVAWSTAGPIGVGTYMRNGASTRVPAIGANQISMSRCSIR